ncbi:MAG: hypothetical protein FWE48_00430 [Coriobacteriia bacterium]|nr:hypothetical protein [Coriobacteriia bacterium]MCL2745553.1 hypothetical protein [Coriobacteriia bacterium]MCL2870431.1 hypothetical protein [Coriobacteriia bacterium]
MNGLLFWPVRFCQSLSAISMKFCRNCRSESGQGVAEYVIILAVIVIACIILAIAFHEQLTSVWQSITEQLGAII